MASSPEQHWSKPKGLLPNSRYPLLVHRRRRAGRRRGRGSAPGCAPMAGSTTGAIRASTPIVISIRRRMNAWESRPAGWRSRSSARGGKRIRAEAGDFIVMPAGVSHQMVGHSGDVLLVGGYPDGRDWDNMQEDHITLEIMRAAAKSASCRFRSRRKDPVTGGPMEEWIDTPSSVDAELNDFRDGLVGLRHHNRARSGGFHGGFGLSMRRDPAMPALAHRAWLAPGNGPGVCSMNGGRQQTTWRRVDLEISWPQSRAAHDLQKQAGRPCPTLPKQCPAIFCSPRPSPTSVQTSSVVPTAMLVPSPDIRPQEPSRCVAITGDWFDRVFNKRQTFVANTIDDIAKVFPDHELIGSMGLGSVINFPLVLGGELVATTQPAGRAPATTRRRGSPRSRRSSPFRGASAPSSPVASTRSKAVPADDDRQPSRRRA